jgi:galactonate dehydratase
MTNYARAGLETGAAVASVESWVAGATHIVRVTDEDGYAGVGQSACYAYPQAVEAVVESFRDYLVGRDAAGIEDHWHQLYRMGPFRGSILSAAVSAVDIALWDIKGQRLGVPIYQLLGGRCRDRIRLHMLLLGWESHAELASWAQAAAADGFTAIKVDPLPRGYGDLALPALVDEIVDAARTVRNAVGRSVDMIIELHRSLPAPQTKVVLDALAELEPLFVEDPVQIDSIQVQAKTAAASRVPLAQGERLHTIWEFRELLEQGGSHYIRPDVGLAGGISHTRKIAALAEAYHAGLSMHSFSGPIVTAAAAHVELSIPNLVTHEWWPTVDDPDAFPGVRSTLHREGGWLLVPEEPGLGVTIKPDLLRPFEILGRPIHAIPRRYDGSVAFAV